MLLLAQLGLVFLDQRIGLVQLVEARDHRIHHLDVALGAGAQDGAELGAEDVPLLQAEPDGPPAEERVHLGRHLQVGEELVAAQVERADDDRQRLERGGGLAVGLVLLLLAGQALAVDEQVFGAEQAHALRAVGLDLLGIGGLLDVGGEQDAMAVQGDGRLEQEVAQLLLQRDLLAGSAGRTRTASGRSD